MSAEAFITMGKQGFPLVLVDCALIADIDLSKVGADHEAEAVGHILTLADDYGLVFRIYRTPQGLRAICVSDKLRPSAPVSKRLLEDINSDWRYVRSARDIKFFSARLGGKPARMGIVVPANFNYFALLPKEQREWDARYNAVSENYKSCEFILQTSECEMPSEIANFIALHDERTKCFANLPMA